MKINIFIKHLIATAMLREQDTLQYGRVNFSNIVVFPHHSTKNRIDYSSGEVKKSYGHINMTTDYHIGFLTEDVARLMNILTNRLDALTDTEGLSLDFVRDSTFSPRKWQAMAQLEQSSSAIRHERSSSFGYVDLSLEVSDILIAKMQSELDNAISHMPTENIDDSDEIFKFIMQNASSFPAISYVYEEKLKIVDFLEKYDAAYNDMTSFLQEDHVRTRMNRFLNAAKVSLDSVVNTSDSIGFSKKPYEDFRRTLSLMIWYMRLYPNIVVNQKLSSDFNIGKMHSFFSRLLDSYAVADALTAILQRGFGMDLKGNDLLSTLLKIMLRGVMNSGTFDDAVAELNDVVFDYNMYLPSYKLNTKSNQDMYDGPKAVACISEALSGVNMNSFINGDVDMEVLPVYTSMYVAESILSTELEKEDSDKMSMLERFVYKRKTYNLDKKRKNYELLLNDINKDLALSVSNSDEFHSLNQKHAVIKEVHDQIDELTRLKHRAQEIKYDELCELIEDRIEYAKAIVDKVNSRVVKDEMHMAITESVVNILDDLHNGTSQAVLEDGMEFLLESSKVSKELEKEEKKKHATPRDSMLSKFMYKRKVYKIANDKKKYEVLLNDINKDLALMVSTSKELKTLRQKNKLIKEVHELKEELLDLKYKANKVGFKDFADVIQERSEYADALVDSINKRTIKDEKSGSSGSGPFHLEGDMADRI